MNETKHRSGRTAGVTAERSAEIKNLVKADYETGLSVEALASSYGYSVIYITRILKEIYGKDAKLHTQKQISMSENAAQIRRRYVFGDTPTEIAEDMNISRGNVVRILKDMGLFIARRDKVKRKNRPRTERQEEVMRCIESGMSAANTAAMLGISRQRVYQIINSDKERTAAVSNPTPKGGGL